VDEFFYENWYVDKKKGMPNPKIASKSLPN